MARNDSASKSLLWGVIETDEFYIIIGLKPYQGIQSRHGIIISNEPQHQRMDSLRHPTLEAFKARGVDVEFRLPNS